MGAGHTHQHPCPPTDAQGPQGLPVTTFRRAQAQEHSWVHCRAGHCCPQSRHREDWGQPARCLTGESVPRRLGPKRANKIRTLFNLTKVDDVTKYVICRTFTSKKGKDVRRAPKIQRLVTPLVLQRKRARKAAKLASVLRNKEDAAVHKKLVAQRVAEQ